MWYNYLWILENTQQGICAKGRDGQMNLINYVVEYEYAAFGICAVLLALFCARRKYPGLSNRIYAAMLLCTLFSCVTHIAAMKTLPISSELPLWMNYLIHILYLHR